MCPLCITVWNSHSVSSIIVTCETRFSVVYTSFPSFPCSHCLSSANKVLHSSAEATHTNKHLELRKCQNVHVEHARVLHLLFPLCIPRHEVFLRTHANVARHEGTGRYPLFLSILNENLQVRIAQRLPILAYDDSTSNAVARVEQCKFWVDEAQAIVHTDDFGWNTDAPVTSCKQEIV
jgi:hypothetical protein